MNYVHFPVPHVHSWGAWGQPEFREVVVAVGAPKWFKQERRRIRWRTCELCGVSEAELCGTKV